MKIGAQLYTVRDFTQTKEDFADTIKKVADIGYECVQVSGIGSEISFSDVAKICMMHNIEIAITHTPLNRIIEDTENVIAGHIEMGAKYIGLGAIPCGPRGTIDDYVQFVSSIAPAVVAIKNAGLKFMYHNHEFEFFKIGKKTGIDFLAENLPEAGFTLDTYWVQLGGGDPAMWLRKLAGRVDVIHLKDLVIVDGKQHMCEIYEGNLNWCSIFDAAKDAGVKYAMVEQDDCYGRDPFECLQTSFNNLKGVVM